MQDFGNAVSNEACSRGQLVTAKVCKSGAEPWHTCNASMRSVAPMPMGDALIDWRDNCDASTLTEGVNDESKICLRRYRSSSDICNSMFAGEVT
jgi:hypothetical protein